MKQGSCGQGALLPDPARTQQVIGKDEPYDPCTSPICSPGLNSDQKGQDGGEEKHSILTSWLPLPRLPLQLPPFHNMAGLCLPVMSLFTPQGGSRVFIFLLKEQPRQFSQFQRMATRIVSPPLKVPSSSCPKPTFLEATLSAESPALYCWEEGTATGERVQNLLALRLPMAWEGGISLLLSLPHTAGQRAGCKCGSESSCW